MQGAALAGLREIARIHDGDFRLTPNQNLVIANVAADERATSTPSSRATHWMAIATASPLRRFALACVALPTCTLAMAEAERYLPEFLDRVEALLDKHALRDAPILLRLSGCPNGCSRPYLGEIALVGKAPGRYNLHLGADFQGRRLNRLYRENIDRSRRSSPTLDPLFARYAGERAAGEAFGDFLLRTGHAGGTGCAIPVELLP